MSIDRLVLKNKMEIPQLGIGTCRIGEKSGNEENEIEAIRSGIEAGINLIDTAEMYGNGKAEKLIRRAIQDYDRKEIFIVSKVYPHNAGRKSIFKSLDKSLENLGTDYLDIYFLHWRGQIPLSETVSCMEEMVAKGKIKSW